MKWIVYLLIIAIEIYGLTAVAKRHILRSMMFYTQLSNAAGLLSAAALLIFGGGTFVIGFRYLSVCMLIMTFLVTVFILVPTMKNTKLLLWSRSGFFLHIVGPFANTAAYFLLEAHAVKWMILIPPVLTLIYGLIMIYYNYKRVIEGPYPFFKVYEQGTFMTIVWVIILLAVIGVIAFGVYALGA